MTQVGDLLEQLATEVDAPQALRAVAIAFGDLPPRKALELSTALYEELAKRFRQPVYIEPANLDPTVRAIMSVWRTTMSKVEAHAAAKRLLTACVERADEAKVPG